MTRNKRKMLFTAAIPLALSFLLAATAMATDQKRQATSKPAPSDAAVERAILILHDNNQEKMQLAQMAEEKASDASVRRYARAVMQETESNQRQIEQMAKQHGVELPEIVTVGEPVAQKPTGDWPAGTGRDDQDSDGTGKPVTRGEPIAQKPRANLADGSVGLDQETLDRLRRADGKTFDRQLLVVMTERNGVALAQIQELRAGGRSRSLDDIVTVMEPVLQKQQDGARKILNKGLDSSSEG